MNNSITVKEAIDLVPGKVVGASEVCGVSVRAVYKWINAGRLPRTDYTGETDYANRLSKASSGEFSPEQILNPIAAA